MTSTFVFHPLAFFFEFKMTNSLLIFLCVCVKYTCISVNFNIDPSFTHFLNFIKNTRDTEYYIAKEHDKLSCHYKNGDLISNLLFVSFSWEL